eukprot:12493225-Alexandrium_andersonii.AAC.1
MRLQRGAFDSVAGFGAEIVGPSDSHLLSMRRAVARLHPRYKGKACLTATIEVSRGLADPAVLQAASTAKAWAKRVYYGHYLTEGMEEAWGWLKGKLAKGRLSA